MTAKTESGKEVFKARRIFMSQCTDSLGPKMVLGPDKKLGIIRDTSLQPFRPKRERFDIQLKKPPQSLNLDIRLSYVLRPGDQMPINHWQAEVPVLGLFKPH